LAGLVLKCVVGKVCEQTVIEVVVFGVCLSSSNGWAREGGKVVAITTQKKVAIMCNYKNL